MISLYLDGEIPSPWKEKMEAHLESCTECQALLFRYKKLQVQLVKAPSESVQAVQERVWNRLGIEQAETGAIDRRSGVMRQWTRPALWSRRVTVPLPAIAAAAVLVAVFLFALLSTRNEYRFTPQDPSAVSARLELDDYGVLPNQDLNGVFQYLSNRDDDEELIFRLPESRRFSRSGEPSLVRSADYNAGRRSFR